jgi:hypothetical protein
MIGAICLVVCGLGPLVFQLLSIFGGRSRRIDAIVRRLTPAYSTLQFHTDWGMFTNHREGLKNAHKWGYCLRKAGVVVAESDLVTSLPLLKFLERQRLDDPAVAESVLVYLLDHVIECDLEFDELELVLHAKPRPQAPARLFARFAHDEFVRASFTTRRTALSCQLDA